MPIDFRDRGRRWGVGREIALPERNINWLPLALVTSRDPTHNLGMCPDRN